MKNEHDKITEDEKKIGLEVELAHFKHKFRDATLDDYFDVLVNAEDLLLEVIGKDRYHDLHSAVVPILFHIAQGRCARESGDTALEASNKGIAMAVLATLKKRIDGIRLRRPKPAKPSHNVTLHVGGDLSGNVQIAGDGARQAITRTLIEQGTDLLALAEELAKLRGAISPDVADADQAIAVGRIAEAEVAAKAQDGEKVRAALAVIGKGAGRWMLGTAKEIGAKLLVEYLETKCGL
ncbi:MAG: hypothetical protein F8N15_10540 [Methanobacterium sp.]|nr:hypothetical protein [Methanobacterium sp.]